MQYSTDLTLLTTSTLLHSSLLQNSMTFTRFASCSWTAGNNNRWLQLESVTCLLNEWGCMSCILDFRTWDCETSSCYLWMTVIRIEAHHTTVSLSLKQTLSVFSQRQHRHCDGVSQCQEFFGWCIASSATTTAGRRARGLQAQALQALRAVVNWTRPVWSERFSWEEVGQFDCMGSWKTSIWTYWQPLSSVQEGLIWFGSHLLFHWVNRLTLDSSL